MRSVLGIGIAALVAAAATAALTVSDATRISDHPTGAAEWPAATADPAGGMIVWDAHLGDPSSAAEQEVFGRLLGPRGRVNGPQRQLTSFGPVGARSYRAHMPAVSFDARGRRYLLAWTGSTGARDEIWIRLLDARGRPVGRQRRITDFDGGSPYGARIPQIAYNSHRREWLVLYVGTHADGRSGVFTRRVGAGGRPLGRERYSVPTPEIGGSAASVVYDSRRRGYLAAYAIRKSIQEGRIELQRLDRHGRADGPSHVLFDDPARHGSGPKLAFDKRSGRHAVIWEAPARDRPFGPAQAALVDGAGRRLRTLDLGLPAEAQTRSPAITAGRRGGFLGTWTWKVTTPQEEDIHEEVYGRAFSGRGRARSKTRRISYLGRGRRPGGVCGASTSTVTPLRRGYLVAFSGQDCGPAGPEIYAARVSAE